MEVITDTTSTLLQYPVIASATVVLGFLSLPLVTRLMSNQRRNNRTPSLPLPPAIPGLPLIGNLLQLKAKKPHQTFTKWAEAYGPVYSIKTGSSTVVVLNSTDVVKEAMVTRFSSISTRKLSNALKILTSDKCMVATSDYNEFHKTVKRYILTSVLGANAQKRHRGHRDTMIENISQVLDAHAKKNPQEAINLRKVVKTELFGLALKEALGRDLDSSVYVEELGISLSRDEIFQVLVVDPMMGAIEVDWRDFFPYLKWVPNKSIEMKINQMNMRNKLLSRLLVIRRKALTDEQILMLIWETIIEASDTTLVTTEWAMYELAKSGSCQEKLYREINSVCGSDKLTEEHLSQLPYLNAVFHETLRKHSPVPVVPLRYAHEDTQLGGYHIPAGSEIAINIYGCNMDKKQWDVPEEWNPERFLDDKYDRMDLYKTMAFGGGKRVCAGSLQALLISCMSIGALVQNFQWKLKEGEEEDVDTVLLTTHKLHPMQAYMTPRFSR
ncbi:hypothetical protein GIB67_029567 [Kingdonia uniflora]|uniref:Ent-kaurene oxidase n=1 Tax=Kingdonia uniflora TaxID=39325 RepID=A0A7J7LLI9_9MAGN|nr:hypothetical protein GIB67_029567 [Kingdonia uniflora]